MEQSKHKRDDVKTKTHQNKTWLGLTPPRICLDGDGLREVTLKGFPGPPSEAPSPAGPISPRASEPITAASLRLTSAPPTSASPITLLSAQCCLVQKTFPVSGHTTAPVLLPRIHPLRFVCRVKGRYCRYWPLPILSAGTETNKQPGFVTWLPAPLPTSFPGPDGRRPQTVSVAVVLCQVRVPGGRAPPWSIIHT